MPSENYFLQGQFYFREKKKVGWCEVKVMKVNDLY
jgi:hypothetical protein